MEGQRSDSSKPVTTPIHIKISITPETLLLVSCATAFLGIFALLRLRRRSAPKRSTVLLLGPSDAGKTAIFSMLNYSSALPSHTSLQSNIGFMSPEGQGNKKPSPLRLVDIPGHPRIRAQASEYMQDTKGIIFVVDASTIARNGPAVAEHLHTVLNAITSLPPSHPLPSLLIHANKIDLLSSRSSANPATNVNLGVERVRTILERELEKRRISSATGVGVEGLGAEGEETTMGGLECSGPSETFKFQNWDGGEVRFSGGWVDVKRDDGIANEKQSATDQEKEGLDGLVPLKDWIDTLA